MQGGIFVSYRREDAAASAGRLCDHLLRHFPRDHIFFDVDTIEPGLDFVKVLDDNVAKCEVLLAVIGRDWASSKADGKNRLTLPNDFVRIEIESALKRDIRVVPVLVDGAEMPRERLLPKALKPLVRRQAVAISHASFAADTERLINALKRHFEAHKPAGSAHLATAGPKPESQTPAEPAKASQIRPELADEDALRSTSEAADATGLAEPEAKPEAESAWRAATAPEPAKSSAPTPSPIAEARPPPTVDLPQKVSVEIGEATPMAPPETPIQPTAFEAEPRPSAGPAEAEIAPVPAGPLPAFMLDVAAAAVLADAQSGQVDDEAGVTAARDNRPAPAPEREATRIANLLTALLVPLATGFALLYMWFDFAVWYAWATGFSEAQFYSGLFASLLLVVPMLAVVLARSNQGDRPVPFLLYATIGWSLVVLIGAPASSFVIGLTTQNGPWPLFLLSDALVLLTAGLLASKRFVSGKLGLIYGIYFSPMALFSLIAIPETVTRPGAGQLITAALAFAYIAIYVAPYVILWRTRPTAPDSRPAGQQAGFGRARDRTVAPTGGEAPGLPLLVALPYPLVLASAILFTLLDLSPLFLTRPADSAMLNGLVIGLLIAAVIVGASLLSQRARREPLRFLLFYSAGWCIAAATLAILIPGGTSTTLLPVTLCGILVNIVAAIGARAGFFAPRLANAMVVTLYSLPWLILLFVAPAGTLIEAVVLAASTIAAAGAFALRSMSIQR